MSRYRGEGVARHGAEVYRRQGGAPLPVRGRTAAEPTFWEFVQAVLRDGLLSTCWDRIKSSALLGLIDLILLDK